MDILINKMEELKVEKGVTELTKVVGIFTYFGKNRLKELDLKAVDTLSAEVLFTDSEGNEVKDEMSMEGIMLSDVKLSVDSYDNETGILEITFQPSLPFWVLNRFAGYFIPKFENR